MKIKVLSFLLCLAMIFSMCFTEIIASDDMIFDGNGDNSEAEDIITTNPNLDLKVKSAVLMDAKNGTVLYRQNENDRLAPASVTKIMTLLLVAEAIADGRIKLDDMVTVSRKASSMGGSQVFIEEGEQFTVEELLKCTVIASANDAAVALAELISGSEPLFVEEMNKRGKELGLESTSFENCTGLDDDTTNHLTSALDIAKMSRELLKHECVLKYSNIWQDSIRNGEFTLTNTNRLVRYYDGCTGLKTGSTDKAGYCVSATAERNGLSLIAVVMGAETRDERNNAARIMLDFGFSNYGMYNVKEGFLENIDIKRGVQRTAPCYNREYSVLVKKEDISKIELKYVIPESVTAPFSSGDRVGEIIISCSDKELGRVDIYIGEDVKEVSILSTIFYLFKKLVV